MEFTAWDVMREEYTGKYYGLGIQIQKEDDRLVVVSPIEGTPASRLGIQPGDVLVVDLFGKIKDGTFAGDNLSTSIYAKSGNGVVFDGSVRDIEGLGEIKGFNAFVRGWDPSFIQEVMLTGINVPIRIGRAICLPGDVVLAKREGVLFIPAQLAEKVVRTGEATVLRDRFGQHFHLDFYSCGELTEIVRRSARLLKVAADEGGAVEIARGLKAGESLAVRGTFILKSEFLKASLKNLGDKLAEAQEKRDRLIAERRLNADHHRPGIDQLWIEAGRRLECLHG